MKDIIVLGVSVSHRNDVSDQIQTILTNNGCKIKARLGLPFLQEGACTDKGLIIIQLIATQEEANKVKAELNNIEGVKADLMTL